MNSFVLVVAGLPLAGYFLLLSLVRLSGRVVVTTGGRDTAAVLLAISGLVMIGPLELFFPTATASKLGVWIWLPLAMLYGLIVIWVALASRPRLVVYGREPQQVFGALVRACRTLDASVEVNEPMLQVKMPQLSAHVRIDAVRHHDCFTIESFESNLPLAFWDRLLRAVRLECGATSPPSRRRGWLWLALAIGLMVVITSQASRDTESLVNAFREWMIR